MINNKINKSKSFPFISEHSNLFDLELEQMSARQFEKQSGYELWHRGLAHASNRNILETIQCAHGLESLKKMTFETHTKCPSCMIGTATLEDFPKAKHPINEPLYQIHMDSFSSSVKSVEGYNHAIAFVE